MMGPSQDEKSALKFAQIREALSNRCHLKIFEKLLEKEGDINCAVSVGYTVLHFAYSEAQGTDLFIKLLNHGADFTKKNNEGQTVLHTIIEKYKSIESSIDDPFLNAVLSAHISSNNFSNPCNEDGLSHFHIAIMANNLAAVQFFLDSGVSVDEPVSMHSKFLPGYTPLHLAAMYTNTEVVEVLFAHGANMHMEGAKGMTALHLLIKRKLEMIDSIRNAGSKRVIFCQKLQELIQKNDRIINMLMENMSIDNDSLDSIGLSTFHVACTLEDTSAAENLIDQVTDLDHCVNVDSQLWPGYTALHFAAQVSITRVEMLVKEGANLAVKNSKGLTPLDICIERHKIEDVCRVMSLSTKYVDLSFCDGKTKLVSFIRTLADPKLFEKFIKSSMRNINTCISMESALWPGYTPLHLAVLFAENEDVDIRIIRLCLSKGADLSAQDPKGQTALYLAYRLRRTTVVDSILQYRPQVPMVSDEDNLSHLHIVCAAGKAKLRLKKCVFTHSDANVEYKGTSPIGIVNPGSTPLHVCLVNENTSDNERLDMINILLKNGADPYVKDSFGLTPVHWLMKSGHYCKYETLLKQASTDCVAEEYGLSHLHVAFYLQNHSALNRYLDSGANVNLAIKYTKRSDDDPLSFLSRYDGYTPLHLSLANSSCMLEVEKLLKRGADEFARRPDGSTVFEKENFLRHFVATVRKNADLQKRMEREFGWTRLHLCCHMLYRNWKKELANVNARVHSSSPIWRGCTPLHLLMCPARRAYSTNKREAIYSRSKILLDNGADVTLMNEQGESPIHVLVNCFWTTNSSAYEQAALLMKYHKNFENNPVNAHGVSHFHVACNLNDVDAVRGFLSHGVDVNRPVGCCSKWRPGCTPLHLASQFEVVELLISHGADIHAEDVQGLTALHEAFWNRSCDDVITKMVENGADINGTNFRGETPFEMAITGGGITIGRLTFCIRNGCHVNSCNPITGFGYVAEVLRNHYIDTKLWKLVIEQILNEPSTNTFGRTALHHFVTGRPAIEFDDYVLFLRKLTKSNQDIDHQDNEGKTALRVAVEFGNIEAVRVLLLCGADANVVDLNGNSALSYATRFIYSETMRKVLSLHACRLALLKLDVCQIDVWDCADDPDFHQQIAMTRDIKLGVRWMCLCDFLSETGAVVLYPTLNILERRRIDQYFESINDTGLEEIQGFLKLQYRKAVKRIELLSSTTSSLSLLLGFDIPDLCAENIFQYLHNSDLNNIINSVEAANEDMKMEVDKSNL